MDKHWKRCVLRAWHDQYQSPCRYEDSCTHRFDSSTEKRIPHEKANCSRSRVTEFLYSNTIGKLCPDTKAVFLIPYELFAYGGAGVKGIGIEIYVKCLIL